MVTIYWSNPLVQITRLKWNVLKVTQLKVTAMDDMSVAQLMKELVKHMSGPALDFVSSQLQHSSPQT